ncbi:DUF3718 domain-containing protein [Colwellia sp. D2M02]|uniref:DUF3718 domain-containing protein n=1 Tax=Colwellia asteriadis TaxID=517723 RepID=A0ABN1L6F9_9GAMM|nr:DUF3718 domain-containing protein [Colwellia sp. D2M02]MBU2893989.1 DUF3718 domain-containing protein [Colwellia sp. D2M02]
MKTITLLSVAVITASLMSAPAQATSMSLRICEYVQANDKSRLRSFLKENKLKIRNIYDGLECNGDNLLIFAAKSNALEVGEFIIGKLPAKTVKPEIENLAKYSAHLSEEAKER